jgi:hypothetical protein
MPKKRSQALPTSAERYVEFIKSVHLSGLGMDAASFMVDREAFAVSFPPPQKPSATISGRHKIVNRKPDSFVVIVEYTVSVIGNSGSEVVNISCKYSALFSLEKEADQECIERFTDNEVQLVFWPYLRHFVSDCTYRMAIFPLVLPLTSEIATSKNQAGGPHLPNEAE